MMWIQVTGYNGGKEYINVEKAVHIITLKSAASPYLNSRVFFSGDEEDYMSCRETVEELMILINKERELIRKMSGE
jgi:hypothetical protein